MNVLYIAGYGRSGSSILSRLIGQHPRFVSAGEVGRLGEALRDRSACSCGAQMTECRFWGPFVTGAGKTEAREVLERALDTGDGLTLIDSSKTAYRDFLRPLLYRLSGRRISIIHLVRRADQVLASARKGRNKDLEKGQARRRPLETFRTLVGWSFANLWAALYREVFRDRAILIRYEDLLSNPAHALSRIARLTGADFSSVIAQVEGGEPLVGGHEVAGNRVLRGEASAFKRQAQPPVPTSAQWRVFSLIVRPITH